MKFDKLFELYFNTTKLVQGKNTSRQQSDRMGATPWRQGSQNLVPDRDKVDPTLNSKVEQLRGARSGSYSNIQLSDNDLKYIINKYNLQNLSKDKPKYLGKTGILIQWDNMTNKYILKK